MSATITPSPRRSSRHSSTVLTSPSALVVSKTLASTVSSSSPGTTTATARVAVAVVVPGEELLTVDASVFDTTKALGEVRTVLECLELRLGEGVIVADIRSAVGLGHLQVDQQLSNTLGAHAGAAVGMQS